MKLSRISVVMLGVSNLDASAAFYLDRLGMTVKQRISGFVFLDGGGVMLALSEPLGKTADPRAGAAEVVFGVEHVREAYEALRDRGVVFLYEPRVVNGAMWAAAFADPDGHKLSVFGPE